MKTIKELAKEALDVQTACNLSGVVHSFSRIISELREAEPNKGTDYYNTHPIVIVYLDKLNSLAGIQELGNETVMRAFDAVHRAAEERQ